MIVVAVCTAVAVGTRVDRVRAAQVDDLHAVPGVSDQPWVAEFVDSAGRPARWDPCTPIDYVVDLAGAPAGALADVTDALARLSAASGLVFHYDGPTDEVASAEREPYQPARYGSRWAPVLIAWSSPERTSVLQAQQGEQAEAVTVPIAVPDRRGQGGSLVSGEVVMNTDHQLPAGFGPGLSEGEVLMHELGHVVGLGHVSDIGDAMYPTVRGIAEYGPGDLAGLAAVGRAAGCHPAPAAYALHLVPSTVG
jgi:hypothetical protein